MLKDWKPRYSEEEIAAMEAKERERKLATLQDNIWANSKFELRHTRSIQKALASSGKWKAKQETLLGMLGSGVVIGMFGPRGTGKTQWHGQNSDVCLCSS